MIDDEDAITRAYRDEWARVVAGLTRRFGNLDLAEDAAAEAFAAAVARWPIDGVPPNPGAWLTTTANRKGIDRVRRESQRAGKHREAQVLIDDAAPRQVGAIDDDRLRLLFTCCHPALAMESRVALTLRMVAGLTVAEIARALLATESAIGQRITRAKAKIAAARIPYRAPVPLDEQDRSTWDPVLIAEGHRLVRERMSAAAAGHAPGRYQLLAAIGAVHTSAREFGDTDWSQILALYDRLAALDPSPVVALNRAIAVAELHGPGAALPLVDRLDGTLNGYHAFHATRADLLRRLGRTQDARAAYRRAIELAGNAAEAATLMRRGDLGDGTAACETFGQR